MTRKTVGLPGWESAEWFEIELSYDARNPEASLRTVRPAEFAPIQPDEKYYGKRPAEDFVIEYRGNLPRKELDALFQHELIEDGIRERAEAAVLAAERMIKKVRVLPDEEIAQCKYEIPRGAISKCYPFNRMTFYSRVLPRQRTFRVDVLQSEGKGIVKLGTKYLHVYIRR